MDRSLKIKTTVKNRFTRLLISPYILALLATILVVLIFPYRFPKYSLVVLEQNSNNDNHTNEFYEDIDGNGYSDKILVFNSPVRDCGISVCYMPSRLAQEWNFHGQFAFECQDYVISGDYDDNGRKEFYALTVSNDSIFLQIVEDVTAVKPVFRSVFICRTRLMNEKPHLSIRKAPITDLDGDRFKEVIFAVSAGYTIVPRKVFAYDVARDSLYSTPELGINIQGITFHSMRPSGKKILLLDTYASCNVTDPMAALHDRSTWLIALDSSLGFLFPPIELSGKHSGSTNFIIKGKHHDQIGTLYSALGNENPDFFMIKTNLAGKQIKKKQLTEIAPNLLGWFSRTDQFPCTIFITGSYGDIYLFDTVFRFLEKRSMSFSTGRISTLDVDNDTLNEFILISAAKDTLTVLRNELRDPVSINLGLGADWQNFLSVVQRPGLPPLISLFTGKSHYLLSYMHHQLYYWRWLIYSGIFLFILFFTMLVQKIQRIQIQSRLNTEKKIMELQLKIVRNQMDPHFTMNAINAVMDAINREEKEQARENLLHFSKMYRSLVLSADKIKRTLQEELEFTENYLALEKFRFGNRFSYRVSVDACVDRTLDVPKMVIQSPVENAVNHGLLKKEAGGEVMIRVTSSEKKLILEITDNGIGRAASSVSGERSTGKGMEVMEQFFDLYRQITGIRVRPEITDLYDVDGVPAGTQVMITIEY